MGRLSDEERDRALAAFDEGVAALPERPHDGVRAELEEVRRSRRMGGRERR
jgi:hypothetical protein